METTGDGILGRLGEKILGWIALGVLILIGVWIWYIGPEGRGNIWSWVWRCSTWLVIVAAVPWITRVFIARILDVSSNWAGLVLLAALIAVDAIAGVCLMERWPTGWWWLAALATLAVAGTYNYLVAEYLSEQSGG